MRILYTLLLVGVTMVWGWTLVVVQDAVALYGVLAARWQRRLSPPAIMSRRKQTYKKGDAS